MAELSAPAKINLYLKVTDIRSDGYHMLDTGFAFVDVADRITVEATGNLEVTCSVAHLEGEHNLVYRVLTAMRETFDVRQGLRVHVEKRLPEQAGLGGGSSDAATAILAANEMWGLNLDRPALIEFAAPFGADIPCFLFGHASRAAGVGERLTRLDTPLPQGHLLLAHPGIGLSTVEVFRHFDASLDDPTQAQLTLPGGKATIRAESEGATPGVGENDLEAVACTLCPELAALLEAMREGAAQAWMSGSGTACVALLPEREQAEKMAESLRNRGLAMWTHVGRLLTEHPLATGGSKTTIGA